MLHFISRVFLKLGGWTPIGESPTESRYVFIAAPHTSNWDLVWMLAFSIYFRLPLRWVGKKSIFKPPFGGIMKLMGGIPVDRSKRGNQVERMAGIFDEHERVALAIPAEGTRGAREFWKSGFYHIARTAEVPIIPSFLDYGRREGGLGEPIVPTGDLKADMDRIRAFYEGKTGKYPKLFTPPRLRDEGGDSAES